MTTPTTVQARFQVRADTAANWASVNPTLLVNEIGIETDTKRLKLGTGNTAWNSLGYFPSIVSGGTVLGNLEIGTTGTLTFEGSTADGFETTLAVADPTADRTITLPNQSGTVAISGSIADADIAANAEIAVSKLADGTARQLLQTDAAGTGVEWASDIDIPGTLDVTGASTFDGDVVFNTTTAATLPVGTTAERPVGASGMIRFNSTLTQFEGYNGTAWSSVGGGATGGGADRVFQENDNTVTTDYTLTTNRNAVSAGPITVNSGVTVTIPSGSSWVIV